MVDGGLRTGPAYQSFASLKFELAVSKGSLDIEFFTSARLHIMRIESSWACE